MSALTDVHPFSKAQMNKAPGPDSSSNSECGASIIFHHEKSNFGQTIYIMTIIIIFYNSLWFTHNSLLIHTVSYCYEFLEHHLSKSWLAWPAARLHDWSSHRLKIILQSMSNGPNLPDLSNLSGCRKQKALEGTAKECQMTGAKSGPVPAVPSFWGDLPRMILSLCTAGKNKSRTQCVHWSLNLH